MVQSIWEKWDSQKMVNNGDKGEEEEHVEAENKEEGGNINGKSLQQAYNGVKVPEAHIYL